MAEDTMKNESAINISNVNFNRLADFFSVFSDPTRLKIIVYLLNVETPCCVTKISSKLGLNQPAVSQHMRILRKAGLVKTERDGKFIRYSVSDKHVSEIIEVGLSHMNFPENGGEK